MKARLLLHKLRYFDDGAILEVKLWLVPQAVLGSTNPFKYSLFYGFPGIRVVAYDHERGKGDHRHAGKVERPYVFVSVKKLLSDFEDDIAALREQM